MYKFEEILLGNKSELIKQATIPNPKVKPTIKPTVATHPKPKFNAQGNVMGAGGNPMHSEGWVSIRVREVSLVLSPDLILRLEAHITLVKMGRIIQDEAFH